MRSHSDNGVFLLFCFMFVFFFWLWVFGDDPSGTPVDPNRRSANGQSPTNRKEENVVALSLSLSLSLSHRDPQVVKKKIGNLLKLGTTRYHDETCEPHPPKKRKMILNLFDRIRNN